MTMKLNCDLGESFGPWKMGADELVMPNIEMANIACGGHAGDPLTMVRTLQLAKCCGVEVGAHPGYPDKLGFGRKSIPYSAPELVAEIISQVSALVGLAHFQGAEVTYVKPHGALYNDMMKKDDVRRVVLCAMQGLQSLVPNLKLMMQSTQSNEARQMEASEFGVELLFEAFADRRYDDNGLLTPRNVEGAVLDIGAMLEQITSLKQGTVVTVSGKRLPLHADSLCVHGDNEAAVANIKVIRRELAEGKQ